MENLFMVLDIKEIRKLLFRSLSFLFLFLFVICLVSAQNPIVKEEIFFQYENDGPYVKTRIIERFYKNDQLTNEKELSFEEELNDWYPIKETWYNELGKEIRVKDQYYYGPNLGFYISDTHSTYTEEGQLLGREIFIKENKNEPMQLWAIEEVDYLEDCSFVNKYFFRENPNDEELTFDYQTLSLYDEECRFVERIYSQRSNESIDQLRKQIRIHFDTTSDGYKRRLVERLICPETFGCNDWERINLMVFDDVDRVIVNEEGSRDGNYRVSRNITFESDQTIYTTKIFRKLPNQDRQDLSLIEETIRDLNDNILSFKRVESSSNQVSTFIYNDKGLLLQEIRQRAQTFMSVEEVFLDTIYYTYQYHCNDLVFEQNRLSTDYVSSRTTYSYLYPIECDSIIMEPLLLKIYPNPTTNTLSIEGLTFSTPISLIEIIDSKGSVIETSTTISSGIDVSNLSNGCYFLNIKGLDGRSIYNQSFIKSK